MLHHLYDSKPLKTSMGGVRAWHPQNSLSACWMEKTLSKGVCGKKGDMKEWKRTSRRNCVPSPSLEEKPNLTRWGRGDIQANVIYTPDTLILLVAVLTLSFCPTITHTVDLFKFTFCIKKRELFNVAEIASSPLISVLLFSYRNRTPDILLDTRMPRVITTYPRLSCSYVWPYDYFLVNGRWAEVMSATFWRVNICFPPLFFCSHKLDTWAILESEFENKLKRGWASEATIPVLDHVTRIITWKMKQTSNLFKPVIRGSLSTGKLISIYSYFLVSPVWFFFFFFPLFALNWNYYYWEFSAARKNSHRWNPWLFSVFQSFNCLQSHTSSEKSPSVLNDQISFKSASAPNTSMGPSDLDTRKPTNSKKLFMTTYLYSRQKSETLPIFNNGGTVK